jgi:hypothetical protein
MKNRDEYAQGLLLFDVRFDFKFKLKKDYCLLFMMNVTDLLRFQI